MRSFLYVLTALSVLGLAFWAYRQNYSTQAALRDVRSLQGDITDLREALSIQRAEWAYLNRPDRLRELATINFDRLGLLPLQPDQFGQPQDVGYPAVVLPTISDTVDVIGDIAPTEEPSP